MYESLKALCLPKLPPLPSLGVEGEVSPIHVPDVRAIWVAQHFLGGCSHQALCRTLRGLAGPPGAQSPAELCRRERTSTRHLS